MKTRVIKIQSDRQIPAVAQEAADAIRQGLLVGFPTETVYGIAALATDDATITRLRELKAGSARPFSVHLGRSEDALRYVRKVPAAAGRLMAKAWPGPLTLLLPVEGGFADSRLGKTSGGNELRDVLCASGMIALRCPASPVTLAMLSAVDGPVVASSASLPGRASPRCASEMLEVLDGKIDLLVDAGVTQYGRDSTVVQFYGEKWEVLREGVYDRGAIGRLLNRNILFVCTGNTCRSPMAAGLARKVLADHLGCTAGQLKAHGVEVGSAGVFAGNGASATDDAVLAAREVGADISRHRSRELTSELINDADVIFCMTGSHMDEVLRRWPAAADKVKRLDESGDIVDPIGGDQDVYRKTALAIFRALQRRVREGIL